MEWFSHESQRPVVSALHTTQPDAAVARVGREADLEAEFELFDDSVALGGGTDA